MLNINDFNLSDIAKVDITQQQYNQAVHLLQTKIMEPMGRMLDYDDTLPEERKLWLSGIDDLLKTKLGLSKNKYEMCLSTYWMMIYKNPETGEEGIKALDQFSNDRDKSILNKNIPIILEILH